jgi:hypothetical protein
MCRPTLSPLETVETTFRLLATGPQPLALNGHTIGLRRDAIGVEVVPRFVELEVAVPHLSPAVW